MPAPRDATESQGASMTPGARSRPGEVMENEQARSRLGRPSPPQGSAQITQHRAGAVHDDRSPFLDRQGLERPNPPSGPSRYPLRVKDPIYQLPAGSPEAGATRH